MRCEMCDGKGWHPPKHFVGNCPVECRCCDGRGIIHFDWNAMAREPKKERPETRPM